MTTGGLPLVITLLYALGPPAQTTMSFAFRGLLGGPLPRLQSRTLVVVATCCAVCVCDAPVGPFLCGVLLWQPSCCMLSFEGAHVAVSIEFTPSTTRSPSPDCGGVHGSNSTPRTSSDRFHGCSALLPQSTLLSIAMYGEARLMSARQSVESVVPHGGAEGPPALGCQTLSQ